jgi:hypothetical protein
LGFELFVERDGPRLSVPGFLEEPDIMARQRQQWEIAEGVDVHGSKSAGGGRSTEAKGEL